MPAPTVLVVDDDIPLQRAIAAVLADEGYRVITAVDGAAVPLAGSAQPDLLLLDFMMMRMNGVAVSRRLRADPATAHIPIIGISAAPTQARRAGMLADAWLPKPFDLSDLLASIRRCLGAGGTQRRYPSGSGAT